jgi:hypothetical protein
MSIVVVVIVINPSITPQFLFQKRNAFMAELFINNQPHVKIVQEYA